MHLRLREVIRAFLSLFLDKRVSKCRLIEYIVLRRGFYWMIIMNNMIKLGNNNLQSKILIALFLSIISPFKTELIILSIMIVIDTITGSLYAIRCENSVVQA